MQFDEAISVLPKLLVIGFMIFSIMAVPSCSGDEGKAKDSGQTKKTAAKVDPESVPPVRVAMKTSMGDIVLELNAAKAPITVANFLSYTDKGFYDGTIFHRVISNFMIQGGGFTEDMQQKKTDPPIENEWKNGLKNVVGSIAMARLGRQPNSATSQFFINVKDNPFLDQPNDGAGYAVFGKVVDGMDVVKKIESVETTTSGRMGDIPVEPVIIKTVERLEKEKDKK